MTFTDDQLKAISAESLVIPDKVAALQNQQTQNDAAKAAKQKEDEGNKVFYDNFKGILKAYYDEVKAINGDTYTEYQDTTLDDGARQKGNVHYVGSYPGFKPKQEPSNTGLPKTAQADHELNRLPKVTETITKLKTGYADGNITDELFASYTPTEIELEAGGFVPDQLLVIDQAGSAALVRVLAVTTPPPVVEDPPNPNPPPTAGQRLSIVELAAPSGGLGVGARVRNFHPGFSNAQREGTATTSEPEVLVYFKAQVDPEVAAWKGFLESQKTALEANEANGTEKTQNDAAKANVQAVLDKITTWESAPLTGAGVGKYGDTAIGEVEAKVTARTADAPARKTEIETSLGTLTQAADGEYSGTGNWHSLFKWIDVRISKAGGTLLQFYNFDIVIKYLATTAATMLSKKAEYDATLLTKRVIEEPVGNFIKLTDTTGLTVGNSVKILDDSTTPVLNATIQGISGQLVELDSPATAFSVDQNVRLVKIL